MQLISYNAENFTMGRHHRIEFENAWYHVMNRGAARRVIFPTDALKSVFLDLLSESVRLYEIQIHAYCLMDNHFHLLIKTPAANLNLAMQRVLGMYTRKHNWHLGKDGPLFRSRYKAILIAEKQSLARVSRYIHRNPIEAKITDDPNKYPWSSYKDYLKPKQAPYWLSTNEVTNLLSINDRVESYANFVEQSIGSQLIEYYCPDKIPSVFGSEYARDIMASKSNYARATHDDDEQKISQLVQKICRNLSLPPDYLTSQEQLRNNVPRQILIHLAQKKARLPTAIIGKALNITPSAVSKANQRFEKLLKTDPALSRQVTHLHVSCVSV